MDTAPIIFQAGEADTSAVDGFVQLQFPLFPAVDIIEAAFRAERAVCAQGSVDDNTPLSVFDAEAVRNRLGFYLHRGSVGLRFGNSACRRGCFLRIVLQPSDKMFAFLIGKYGAAGFSPQPPHIPESHGAEDFQQLVPPAEHEVDNP